MNESVTATPSSDESEPINITLIVIIVILIGSAMSLFVLFFRRRRYRSIVHYYRSGLSRQYSLNVQSLDDQVSTSYLAFSKTLVEVECRAQDSLQTKSNEFTFLCQRTSTSPPSFTQFIDWVQTNYDIVFREIEGLRKKSYDEVLLGIRTVGPCLIPFSVQEVGDVNTSVGSPVLCLPSKKLQCYVEAKWMLNLEDCLSHLSVNTQLSELVRCGLVCLPDLLCQQLLGTQASTAAPCSNSASFPPPEVLVSSYILFLVEVTIGGPWCSEHKKKYTMFEFPKKVEKATHEVQQKILQHFFENTAVSCGDAIRRQVATLCSDCVVRVKQFMDEATPESKPLEQQCGAVNTAEALSYAIEAVLQHYGSQFSAVLSPTTNRTQQPKSVAKCCGNCVTVPPNIRSAVESNLEKLTGAMVMIGVKAVAAWISEKSSSSPLEGIAAEEFRLTTEEIVDLILPPAEEEGEASSASPGCRKVVLEAVKDVYKKLEKDVSMSVKDLERELTTLQSLPPTFSQALSTTFTPYASAMIAAKMVYNMSENMCSMGRAVGGSFSSSATARLRDAMESQHSALTQLLSSDQGKTIVRRFGIPIDQIVASFNYFAASLDPPVDVFVMEK